MHWGIPLVPLVGAVCKQEVGNKQRWPPSVIASSSTAIAIYCNARPSQSITLQSGPNLLRSIELQIGHDVLRCNAVSRLHLLI